MSISQAQQHLIFGTGPAACWTAKALVDQGISVKAINRTGTRPALMPDSVGILKCDVLSETDLPGLLEQCRKVAVVYQMLNPRYSQWEELFPSLQRNTMKFAQTLKTKYIALENLYSLDHRQTMTETSPSRPSSIKGQVRLKMHQELMAAHHSGHLSVTTLRASDFFGPGVLVSAFGSRLFDPLMVGKAPSLMGDMSQPHSLAYIADVGRAAAALGLDRSGELMGLSWLAPHNPALTQEQWLKQVLEQQKTNLGLSFGKSPKVVKPWMLRLAGLFDKDAKALVEMMYQFQTPFVVDSSLSHQQLRLRPTPLNVAIEETLDWYKRRHSSISSS